VIVVGPPGLRRRRWYLASAIAMALALYAGGASSAAVRERTSPARAIGLCARERLRTLARWVEAARSGALFGVAGLGRDLTRRQVAEQVTLALAARAGRRLGGDLVESAFAGALAAA